MTGERRKEKRKGERKASGGEKYNSAECGVEDVYVQIGRDFRVTSGCPDEPHASNDRDRQPCT